MSLTDNACPMKIKLVAMQDTIDRHAHVLERVAGFMAQNRPTLREIVREVCSFYRISRDDLVGISHRHEFSHPRLVTYYLARRLTRLTLHDIARRMGGRDHGTIYSGVERITKRMHTDQVLCDDIDVLRSRLAECVLARKGCAMVLPLDEFDHEIGQHLSMIRDGADICLRHVQQMLARPNFETLALDDLQQLKKALLQALETVMTAEALYHAKPPDT